MIRPGVSSLIPKQKYKACNGARQALQGTKNFNFKSQKNKTLLVTFFDGQGILNK
jgi:hypothetical protein